MSGRRNITCPLCGQPASETVLNVEYGENGLPLAAAVSDGWGVPVTGPLQNVRFHVDGREVTRVVAYSIPDGFLWRHQATPDGDPVHDGETFKYEQLTGEVQVENRHPLSCGERK